MASMVESTIAVPASLCSLCYRWEVSAQDLVVAPIKTIGIIVLLLMLVLLLCSFRNVFD
jgi:DMSO/TMAO reductase YedYZ heme-binding membrane subunit